MPTLYDENFKILFSNEKHIEILTLLLSRILDIEEDELKEKIELAPLEVRNETVGEKKTTRDIVVRIKRNPKWQILIEANFNLKDIEEKLKRKDSKRKIDKYVMEKNLYYFNQLAGTGLKESEGYDNMTKTILINLNTFFVDKEHLEVIDEYGINNKYLYKLTENRIILNINVVECYRIWYNGDDGKYDKRTKDIIRLGALLVITKLEELRRCIGELNTSSEMKKLIEGVIIRMNENEEYWGRYYNVIDEVKRMNKTILNVTKQESFDKGVNIGTMKATNDMVINLNNQGIGLDIISKATNLGINKIKKILEKSNQTK